VLVGIDRDSEALAHARNRLGKIEGPRVDLIEGDFLDLVGSPRVPDLFASPSVIPHAHLIIANPPFVRTQELGAAKAQELAATFGLSGRVDLYQAFLVAMSSVLVDGGTIGIILSNRFLSTKSGASTRAHFTETYELLEVVDFGDTKLFEAAVLPAAVVARKADRRASVLAAPPLCVRIYERVGDGLPTEPLRNVGSIQEALAQSGAVRMNDRTFDVVTGTLILSSTSKEPWRLVSDEERHWMDAVEVGASARIGDLVDVRVGIKTTADGVFIRDDWDALPPDQRPEPDVLLPLITSGDARASESKGPGAKRVLYTHTMVDGRRRVIDLEAYPNAATYLRLHYERLNGRAYVRKAKRAWYEIWVPQDPSAWASSKLVWPDISEEPRFSLDESGSVVNGDCYWIGLGENADPSLLLLIQGVANSELMTTYHDLAFRNLLYSGRRRYLTQYVALYPLPDPAGQPARDIMEAVSLLNASGLASTEAEALREQVDQTVYQAFGVDPFRNERAGAELAEEVRG
jgi:hypothetical protein